MIHIHADGNDSSLDAAPSVAPPQSEGIQSDESPHPKVSQVEKQSDSQGE